MTEEREIQVFLTLKEVMALADAAQLVLATSDQYAHVAAITQCFPGLVSARPKLVRAALKPDPYEGWSEEADGTVSPPISRSG